MSKISILDILFLNPPKPAGAGTGGETSNNRNTVGQKPNYLMYVLMTLGVIAVLSVVLYAGQSTSTGAPVSNPPPAPGIEGKIPAPVVTATPGTATPTQVEKETTKIAAASVYMTEFQQTTGRSSFNVNPEIMIDLSRNKYDTDIRLPRFAMGTTTQYTDLHISNLNIDNQAGKITGEIENRGNKDDIAGVTLLVLTNDYKTSDFTASFISVVGNHFEQVSGQSFTIKPGGKSKFEISQKTLTTNQYALLKEYLPKAQYGTFATSLR